MGMYFAIRAIDPGEAERLLADPDFLGSLPPDQTDAMSVSLEKSWHGLHYLLTGSATEGEMPLAFLLHGGEPLGEDTGYGPPRSMDHEAVAELHAVLSAISDSQFWSRFNPAEMEAEGVYPGIWDEPEEDLREEYLGYFQAMKDLVAKANRDKLGLLLMLT